MVRLETSISWFLKQSNLNIYIPVWLDQKPDYNPRIINPKNNLHSSMVRLETIL